jgi:hypothetical protein
MQQRAAKGLLQSSDLLADGRLGAVDPLAGTGEATCIDDRDKASEQAEIEHRLSTMDGDADAPSPRCRFARPLAAYRATVAGSCSDVLPLVSSAFSDQARAG